MPDPALQLLLDPGDTGKGIRITDRIDSTDATKHNYCVTGGAIGNARLRWVETASGDSDATKNTTIRTVIAAG